MSSRGYHMRIYTHIYIYIHICPYVCIWNLLMIVYTMANLRLFVIELPWRGCWSVRSCAKVATTSTASGAPGGHGPTAIRWTRGVGKCARTGYGAL